jgi:hypothetical protein
MNRNPSNSAAKFWACVVLGPFLLFSEGRAAEATGEKPVGTNAPVASATNSVPATGEAVAKPAMAEPDSGPTSLDFSAFRKIADRNIFNSGRSGRTARSGERPRVPQVESVTVVGTMSYAKGDTVFFDGSSSAYRRALKLGDTIAGHEVVAITTEQVELEADGKKFKLKVGGTVRREDEGPWEVSSSGVSHAVATAATASGSAESSGGDSGGEVSEVLKRLLQKRKQEEKNENQ